MVSLATFSQHPAGAPPQVEYAANQLHLRITILKYDTIHIMINLVDRIVSTCVQIIWAFKETYFSGHIAFTCLCLSAEKTK